ncbi:MAG: helix-turn-helix transcriptional regulator [Oscillospiraceae bacterium]|nr:helix-turn-helix transcriptional regulator [Oscillospiraceae bacterium]
MKLDEMRRLARLERPVTADQQQLFYGQLRNLGIDPTKVYQELEMSSRFVDTHQDTSFYNAHIQLHSHAFYELLYCCNSCGAEYLVGSERYRLQEGDIIFVPPGISHRPLLPDQMDAPYRRYVLWLSTEFMELYARLFSYSLTDKQARANMLRTGGTAWAYLGELFRSGVQEAEQKADGWEAALIGNTIQLLTQIKRATDARTSNALKAEKPELLDRIMAYIEGHYASRITISALSRRFYVSGSTISHLFKQKMGVSLYRYVTQRRLIAAKTLIEKGQLLENVAVQTGFSDYSGFYRAFRQEYGISPRQYRGLLESIDKGSII